MGGGITRPIGEGIAHVGNQLAVVGSDITRTIGYGISTATTQIAHIGNTFNNTVASLGHGIAHLGHGFLNQFSNLSNNISKELSTLVSYVGSLFGYIQIVLVILAILLVVIILSYVFRGHYWVIRKVMACYMVKNGNSKDECPENPEVEPLNSKSSNTASCPEEALVNNAEFTNRWNFPQQFQNFFKSSNPERQMVGNCTETFESNTTTTKTSKTTSSNFMVMV